MVSLQTSSVHQVLTIDFLNVAPIRAKSLVLPAGITAVSAPSGSGKSRFFRAIADLVVNDGIVSLGEIDRAQISAPEWRKQVRYVSSEPAWWGATMRDNIPQGDTTESLLEKFGLAANLMDSPLADLSSGERQRFGLIRALHDDPKVLLLDEPTAALDEALSIKVETELTERALNGRIVLLVSHSEAQIARIADRVLTIENGQVVERV